MTLRRCIPDSIPPGEGEMPDDPAVFLLRESVDEALADAQDSTVGLIVEVATDA